MTVAPIRFGAAAIGGVHEGWEHELVRVPFVAFSGTADAVTRAALQITLVGVAAVGCRNRLVGLLVSFC